MTPEEAVERKRTLSTQLRRIDDALDTARGDREADPQGRDLPWRWDRDADLVLVTIEGVEYGVPAAEELTRAGLHECDVVLEEAGWL